MYLKVHVLQWSGGGLAPGPSSVAGTEPRCCRAELGLSPSTLPNISLLAHGHLPGELLHQEGTNPVLVLLYFHQQHDVAARNDLQEEGAEGSLCAVGFRRIRKALGRSGDWCGEVLGGRSGAQTGVTGGGTLTTAKSFSFQREAGAGRGNSGAEWYQVC